MNIEEWLSMLMKWQVYLLSGQGAYYPTRDRGWFFDGTDGHFLREMMRS